METLRCKDEFHDMTYHAEKLEHTYAHASIQMEDYVYSAIHSAVYYTIFGIEQYHKFAKECGDIRCHKMTPTMFGNGLWTYVRNHNLE